MTPLLIVVCFMYTFKTGKYFSNFEIPNELTALWNYMHNMYQLDAFTQSCPADQDIINHYKLQIGSRMKKHEELETPTYTTSIPITVPIKVSHQ